MYDINLDYYIRRMCEEREAAARSADPRAAAAHEEMAARYEAVLVAYDHPVLHGDNDPCAKAA